MKGFTGFKRAEFQDGGEGEAIGFDGGGDHLGVVREGKVVEAALGVAVDNGGPEKTEGLWVRRKRATE